MGSVCIGSSNKVHQEEEEFLYDEFPREKNKKVEYAIIVNDQQVLYCPPNPHPSSLP